MFSRFHYNRKLNMLRVFFQLVIVFFLAFGLSIVGTKLSKLSAQHVVEEQTRAPIGSLVMSFAGDVHFPDLVARNKLGMDPAFLYQELTPLLHGDDASFVDISAPLLQQKAPAGFGFAQMSDIDALVQAGFDVFSLANEQMLEQKQAVLAETEKNWQVIWQRYPWIRHNGMAEPGRPLLSATVFSRQNKKIAFLAMMYVSDQVLKSSPGAQIVNAVDFSDKAKWDMVRSHIRKLSQEVDLVIVSYHGQHAELQKRELWWAALRQLIDAGAHIVWNHHPFDHHQPIEFYQDRVIIHNTGTLLSNQIWDPKGEPPDMRLAHTGNSILYRVTLHWYKSEVNKVSERFIVEAMPLGNYQDPKRGRVVFRSDDQRFLKIMPEVWQNYYENLLEGWAESLPYQRE